MKRINNVLILSIIYIFLVSAFAYAQTGRPQVPIEVSGDSVEFLAQEQVMIAEDNVIITYQDVKMTCDRAKVYMTSKKAIAEGHVRLTFQDKLLLGEKIEYDFESKNGVVLEIEGWAKPIHFGTQKASKMFDTEYKIENGFMTTSDITPPEYQVRAKTIQYFPDEKVVTKNAVVYVGKMPVFYLPAYTYYFKKPQPQFSVSPGKKSNWGYYVLSAYRYNISEALDGQLRFDFRTKRGFAAGIDTYYDTKVAGKGFAKYYFVEDWQKNLGEPDEVTKDRFRAQWRHRWDIAPNALFMGEAHRTKDKKMIKDYFYREEYAKDTQPPSYLYGLYTKDQFAFTGVVQYRLNKFEKVTERLPELKLDIKKQQIANTALYYKGSFQVSHFNNRYAFKTKKEDVMRADTEQSLTYFLKMFRLINVTPYAGVRSDVYSRLVDGNLSYRHMGFAGTNVNMNVYGYSDFTTNWLGLNINKIRHILTPTFEYRYQAPSTIEETKIINSDSIDRLNMESKFKLGLVNKLQTKRTSIDGDEYTVNLMRSFVGTEYWHRGQGRGHFEDIISDFEFRPWSWFAFSVDSRFNRGQRRFETINFDLFAEQKEKWEISVGHRYATQESSRLETELLYYLNPKWGIRVYESFEFDTNDFKEQEYAIIRDLHAWSAEAGFNVSGPYGKTIYFVLTLKAFPELPFSFKTHVPKRDQLFVK